METPEQEQPFQFTLRTLFIASALVALFLGLGIQFHMPLLFPTVAIGLIACCAWHATRANVIDILLAATGAEFLTLEGYGICTVASSFDFNILFFLAFLSAGLMVFGGVFFLASATKSRSARWQNVVGCSASFLLPLVWFFVLVPIGGNALQVRLVRRDAQNAATMQTIISDVNAVCARLGRVPESEEELAKSLGGTMPQIDLGSNISPIHYSRLGPDHFQMSFINANWNISLYDSQTPKRGWYEIPF